jgi:hypothetical protein
MGETKISAVDDDANAPHRHSNLLLTLPTHLWRHVLMFFGYKDHTLAGQSCQYLKRLWTEAMEKGKLPLFVPVDCTTLQEAVNRVHENDRLTTIVVGQGEHQIDSNYLEILSAMNIVGDPGVPKSEIVVVGGIQFNDGIQGKCHLQHLTLRQAKGIGVRGRSSFTMDEVLVEQCRYGVLAYGTGVVGRCTNVEVRQCESSGVYAFDGASITLIGAKTTVHHNCTSEKSWNYGLLVYGSSSSTIQLVSPLTKEQVSLDNGGGGNWGADGGGDINQIKTIAAVVAPANETISNCSTSRDVFQTLPTFMKKQILAFFGYKDYTLTGRTCQYLKELWTAAVEKNRLPLFVPVDCKTLREAVNRVHENDRLTTIVVGTGEHQIDSTYLKITSAMNIVGDPGVPKSEIVVVGGIKFEEGIQGNCHLEHLTLRFAKGIGVSGESSFTMEDVLVEQCRYGVCANGTGVVGRCSNVEVRQCGLSGVLVEEGASITLIGAKTTVHHNCTDGDSDDYGLAVFGSSASTIQLVAPLTKEHVSLDNGGGGNWGAESGDINQIKTIAAVMTTANETTSNSSTPCDVLQTLPKFMKQQILVFCGYNDYMLTGRTCQYLKRLWTEAIQNHRIIDTLFVPVDCNTLKEAVGRVHKNDRLTIIVLGKGEHQINGTYLEILSAMNIVGDPGVPKSEIVVVGGIRFKRGIQGNSHLQHLTLRQAKWSGVRGDASFTMEDVMVEQCGNFGVDASGTGVVGRCINVEVRQCEWSGVIASSGASITLIGAKTKVHHNCTKGDSGDYGLLVYNSSSTIQLVSPLTKDHVSLDNGGGGNWGAGASGDINQIKTI